MDVTLMKVDDVKPYEGNPRVNDPAVDAVAASLREFGFRQPIVVDEAGVIIVGHTRWKAAKKLGLAKVPVHVAKDLSPEQAKAYRLADNQTNTLAEWDYELLPIELKDLQAADFDLDLLGFDTEALAQLLDGRVQEGLTDPDEVPAPPDEAVTRPGDLYILGQHRLLCGDSGKPEDVDRLLDGQPVHLVNTDPPYNVKVASRSNNAIAATGDRPIGQQGMDMAIRGKTHATDKKLRAKDRPLVNDFVSDEEFARLLRAWFGNIQRVLEPGHSAYIWGGYSNIWNYPNALRESGLYFSQMIIWVKEHPVLTRKDFMGNHEWCQPPDTSVLTPCGSASIASLRNGDRVVSFSTRSSAVVGLRHGMEVMTTRRDYRGPLYGVVVGDRSSWCTDGHVWSVKMTPRASDVWCVYLMQRGAWWRVGSAKLRGTWGFGVKQRLSTEGGEAAWVLSIHPTKGDAAVAEQIVSTTYGIPTTFWRESPSSQRSDAQIRSIYEVLDPDQLERGARQALADHHRDVLYPFLRRGRTRAKHGCRVPLQVRACNLLPDVMAVPVPRDGQRFEWVPIRAVDVQSYAGPVHSMAVDKHRHYIADGIVTHNCFYSWREGAAHRFFGPANVTDVWSVKKVNPQSMVHLTEKPVELAVRAIQYSSQTGENVLDLFGGSGSTLIGCEQTGRRAFLMEIDPLYADVIVQRWEKFTGRKAERICSSEPQSAAKQSQED